MTKQRIFAPSLFILLLLISGYRSDSSATPQAGAEQPEVQWIRSHAVRLQTPEASHGFADMRPLKKIVGNARIVSLGEATHGTREFFQLKHRMLEFLASEMGFTIFSIEANMPEAYRLNDFVLNGQGDPAKLIKGMYFWTWNTQEVLDMVLWMREFNKSGKGRVQFTGFDMQTPDVAAEIVREFVDKNDSDYAATLHKATDLAKAPPRAAGPGFGVATGTFPVSAATGKRIRYSGYIKSENITRGFAGLWWRIDGASGVLAFDNMQDRGVKGTTDWKRYEIELPVAADAKNINFGAIHTGDGSAWFDGLSVEVDNVPFAELSQMDPDFEGTAPKMYTGGNGYQVQFVSDVFHSGKQSLRMKFAGSPAGAAEAVDPKVVAASWQDVIRHLEESREAYVKKGIAARDVEWVIQNARVVLQCMQMRANIVSRDQSMAANIKWILDNNPNAKIVLWAHNGHVSTSAVGAYEPMGVSLRKMFGDSMVVFGFAFNQGSFQAVERGKGLRDFTVTPAPADSLDATLAATSIPLFALDLRTAPKSGPVATWLALPHKTRSIGALYSEEAAAQYFWETNILKAFDVLLFVDKTTAARKIAQAS
ncbi:MAG TPA: erythromycin esterase family protein [Pyrinomonadaceae bacterium]|nr:erythromycin esterase family protein [Pyrinomonadaceae bacterium]